MRQRCSRVSGGAHAIAAVLLLASLGLAGPVPPSAAVEPAQTAAEPDVLPDILRRVADQVRIYYERFRTIICTEEVEQTRLQRNFAPIFPRRSFTFDLRLEPRPGAGGTGVDFQAVRRVRLVDGKPASQDAPPQCMDPAESFSEYMSFLLDAERANYAFAWVGRGRAQGAAAYILDFTPIASEPPDVSWEDNCFKLRAPGHAKGRIWVDQDTFEVLRIDSRLVKSLAFDVPAEQRRAGAAPRLRLERSESSIRYGRVTFRAPDEVVLLPASVETLTVIEGAAVPRLRVRQSFRDYRRFLTDAHVRP